MKLRRPSTKTYTIVLLIIGSFILRSDAAGEGEGHETLKEPLLEEEVTKTATTEASTKPLVEKVEPLSHSSNGVASTEPLVEKVESLSLSSDGVDDVPEQVATTVSEDESTPPPLPPPAIRKSSREIAKTVTLVPVDTATGYAQGRLTILSEFTLKYRRVICEGMLDFVPLPNAEFDTYIFATHLYEFEYPDAETPSQVSVAIHCPTNSYPRLFLRMPADGSDDDMKVVRVLSEERHSSQQYTYTLALAKSIKRPTDKDQIKAMSGHEVMHYTSAELSNMCHNAHERFKYGLLMRLDERMNGHVGVYEVDFVGAAEGVHVGIKCNCSPVMYLLFVHSDSEIKITFRDRIVGLIEGKSLFRKPELPTILL